MDWYIKILLALFHNDLTNVYIILYSYIKESNKHKSLFLYFRSNIYRSIRSWNVIYFLLTFSILMKAFILLKIQNILKWNKKAYFLGYRYPIIPGYKMLTNWLIKDFSFIKISLSICFWTLFTKFIFLSRWSIIF